MITETNENKDNFKVLIIDEKENAIDSLEMCLSFLKETKTEKYYWKWISIAIYNALYGFMICALTQGNPDNVLSGAKDYLIDFKEALKRIQKKKYMKGFGVDPIILSEEEKDNIEILRQTLRNNFEHFSPKGWIIELSGVPRIINTALEIIEHLCSSNIIVFFDENKSKYIKELLKEIKLILQNEK